MGNIQRNPPVARHVSHGDILIMENYVSTSVSLVFEEIRSDPWHRIYKWNSKELTDKILIFTFFLPPPVFTRASKYKVITISDKNKAIHS